MVKAVLTILLWTILYYLPIILRYGYLWIDFLVQNFPTRLYAFERLKHFELPLWDPYIMSGHPIAADLQHGIFFPLNWLIVPFMDSGNLDRSYYIMELQAIFSVFLAGTFMYSFLRYLRLARYSALFGTIIYTFSGFYVLHLGHINIIHSAMWLPLIFMFFAKGFHQRSWRLTFLASLFLGLSLLGGHPQIVMYSALLVGAYLTFVIFIGRDFSVLNIIGEFWRFIVFNLVGLAVASVQLIPFIEFYLQTNRFGQDVSQKLAYSLNPIYFLISIFMPHSFGGFKGPFAFNVELPFIWNQGEGNYWELTGYLGIIGIFLLTLSYFIKIKTHNNYFKFFKAAAVVSILLAFGNYLLPTQVFEMLPLFNLFRGTARFLFIYTFTGAVVIAFMFDYIYLHKKRSVAAKLVSIIENSKRRYYLLFTIFVLFSLAIVMASAENFLKQMISNYLIRIGFTIIYIFLTLFDSAILFIFLKNFKKILAIQKKRIVLGIVFFDLFLFGGLFNIMKLTPSDFFLGGAVKIFHNTQEVFRIASVDNQVRLLPLNSALIHKFFMIDGFQGLSLRRYNYFTKTLFGGYAYPALGIQDELNINRLSLLNVKYILSLRDLNNLNLEKVGKYNNLSHINYFSGDKLARYSSDIYVYKNKRYVGPAFISFAAIFKSSDDILKEIDRMDDVTSVIYLDNTDRQEISFAADDFNKTITSIHRPSVKLEIYKPEQIILKTSSDYDGLLFLSEIYYAGWKAKIDGVETKVLKANSTFRSVHLPRGEHVIVFYYPLPDSFKLGALVSLSSLLVIISSIILIFKKREI